MRCGRNVPCALIAALALACTPSIPDNTFSCDITTDCPPGFACLGGYCLRGEDSVDAGSDANADAGDGGGAVRDGGPPDGGAPDGGVPDGGPPDGGRECITETCNGEDDDCDGIVDGAAATLSCGTAPDATSAVCSAGACVVAMCVAGRGDCDATFATGCEEDLTRSIAHCGTCGNACGWSCGGTSCDDPTRLVSGEYFSCALLASGRVACWGGGTYGEMGNGSARSFNAVPSLVIGPSGTGYLEDVVQLDAGQSHVCAVVASGQVYCWGLNDAGQLGDGTLTNRNVPTLVVTASGGPALVPVARIAAGGQHTCARRTDLSVWCWGEGSNGQVGAGTFTDSRFPVRVLNASGYHTTQELTAGPRHTCSWTSSGVQCWGAAAALGRGATADSARALPVLGVGGTGTLSGILEADGTCARLASSVVCWGTSAPRTEEGIGGSGALSATAIRVGLGHNCAQTATGLACWGNNSTHQLGDGTTALRADPVLVMGLGGEGTTFGTAIDVAPGLDHTCAIDAAGAVICWGANEYGQIGVPTVRDWNPILAASPARL